MVNIGKGRGETNVNLQLHSGMVLSSDDLVSDALSRFDVDNRFVKGRGPIACYRIVLAPSFTGWPGRRIVEFAGVLQVEERNQFHFGGLLKEDLSNEYVLVGMLIENDLLCSLGLLD